MSDRSKIEWTDATWNPVRGCTKISPGCKHCYAETFAERFRGVPGHPYERGFDPRPIPDKLTEPFRWGSPRTIFANSMSDLFQDAISDDFIELAAHIMIAASWHTFQVLTKRAERLRYLLSDRLRFAASASHIWWGVSVEDHEYGFPRIDHLRAAPAAVRFLSVEPLLEDVSDINLEGIHWVIVGGESGPGARKMEKAWVRAVRDRCAEADVPFFFKQWGGVQKGKAGRELDHKFHDDFPPRLVAPVPDRAARLALIEEWNEKISANSAAAQVVPLRRRSNATTASAAAA
jgi:protein gp37